MSYVTKQTRHPDFRDDFTSCIPLSKEAVFVQKIIGMFDIFE